MPWAIRLLTFQPVFARNINSCTVPWAIHLLGLRPVFARNINTCTVPWAIRLLTFQPVFALSINTCTVPLAIRLLRFRGRKKCLAKFVSFVERGRSLKFQERKIRFFCFIRCKKNNCPVLYEFCSL